MRHVMVLAIIAGGCGDDGDEATESTTTTTSTTTTSTTTTSSTIPGPSESTTPDGTPIVFSSWQQLDAGTTYSSNPTKAPVLRFTPMTSGWEAKDSFACPYDLGTLRFTTTEGRLFVVPTDGLGVDEAVEMLVEGPLVDPAVTETEIGDWSGQSVTATVDDTVNTVQLGPGRSSTGSPDPQPQVVGETLLPYHTVVEDVLDPGSVNPGDDAEIHVADTNTGVVSFVLIAEPDGMMEAFRSKALALADTFEIVATGETTDEEC